MVRLLEPTTFWWLSVTTQLTSNAIASPLGEAEGAEKSVTKGSRVESAVCWGMLMAPSTVEGR